MPSLFLDDIHCSRRREPPYLPMNLGSIKTSVVSRRRPKVVEWVPRNSSRGTKYIEVDVSDSTSQSMPRQDTAGIKNNERTPQKTSTLPMEVDVPMEVDETLWMNEPAIPEREKRVSLPAHSSLAIFDKSAAFISQSTPT